MTYTFTRFISEMKIRTNWLTLEMGTDEIRFTIRPEMHPAEAQKVKQMMLKMTTTILDFPINRFFMKLFNTIDMQIVIDVQLQSINQSIRNCLSSRTTSRLIVKLKQILVHMMMSGYDFLKSQSHIASCDNSG